MQRYLHEQSNDSGTAAFENREDAASEHDADEPASDGGEQPQQAIAELNVGQLSPAAQLYSMQEWL